MKRPHNEKGFHPFVGCAVKLGCGTKCASVSLFEDVG